MLIICIAFAVMMLVPNCDSSPSQRVFDSLPSQRVFDSLEWKVNTPTDDGPTDRAHMIEDLLSNVLQTGMRLVDVEALLGKPDYNSSSSRGTISEWNLGSWKSKELKRRKQDLLLRFSSKNELVAARACGLVPFGTWP